MKVSIEQEIYCVEGIDETGLIPKETYKIAVHYDGSGKIEGLYYIPKLKPFKGKTAKQDKEEHRRLFNKMNYSKKKSGELEQIVALLKKLSSRK